jgi:predicted phage baseplate assembly protein
MSTLSPLSLDDLTYEDLRQMAVQRIPAASGGRWTHHAPVDSGVTLLELFAFLLEQQLFVLDQVPDSLTHAILALLGETPAEAGVASTVVAPPPGTLTATVRLATGTRLQPADPALSGLIFSTSAATLLPPVSQQEIYADDQPVSDRLERGEAVAVMADRDRPGSLAVEVTLAAPLQAADSGRRLALAIVLAEAGVPPQWDAEAVDVPPPGPLTLDWSVPGAEGRISDWEDGTGGLRRSGLVAFPLPSGAVGASQLRLTITSASAAHAAPPQVTKTALGAAIIRHRHRLVIEDHDTGEPGHDALRAELRAALQRLLPISDETLDLPVALAPAIGPSLALRLADAAGEWHPWQAVPDLTSMAPEDRVYRFDRALGRLFFGDGYAGRVPAPVTNLSLALDLGGGPDGNHAAGMRWRPADASPPVELESLAPAQGGAEPETLAEARARIAGELAERHRAVTAGDYVTLSENAPGIGPHRAHVLVGHDPAFPCLYIADSLTVFVVPRTGADTPAPRTDEGALQVIRQRLDAARMLTTRVFVRRPRFRPVGLLIDVVSAVGDPAILAEQLRPVLSDFLHPAIGGQDGTGWPFGGPLRPSELLRVADAALGPGPRVERVTIRLIDTADAEEDCTELAIGPAELVQLERLVVRVRREPPPETTL